MEPRFLSYGPVILKASLLCIYIHLYADIYLFPIFECRYDRLSKRVEESCDNSSSFHSFLVCSHSQWISFPEAVGLLFMVLSELLEENF